MIVFQFEAAGKSYLCVMLESDNLARMEKGDPITLNPESIGGSLMPITHPGAFHVLIAYEKDPARAYELYTQQKPQEFLDHLMRGYQYTATDGLRFSGPGGKS